MGAKPTRLAQKAAILGHVMAESCVTCCYQF